MKGVVLVLSSISVHFLFKGTGRMISTSFYTLVLPAFVLCSCISDMHFNNTRFLPVRTLFLRLK